MWRVTERGIGLCRSHCGGCSATFDTPSRTNLRSHTSHPPEDRFLPAGPSGLELVQRTATSPRGRGVKVSDRGLPCHEFEPSITKDSPSTLARILRRTTVVHKPKRVVSCRAGGPKRSVSRRAGRPEWEPPYMDCDSFGTHPYPRDCRRIVCYCAIFAVSRSLDGRNPLCTLRFDHRRKKPCTASNVGGDSRYPSLGNLNHLTGLRNSARRVADSSHQRPVEKRWIACSAFCGLQMLTRNSPPPTALAVSISPRIVL
ncbi:hypothetical protein TNCV_4487891 [Trichonephila clavipes]|nr:hypothetical protein TNCV_4487891 [Trichonephila clavipes]